MKKTSCVLLLAAIVMLGACSGEREDLGIVARINGTPIYLDQLEFEHDIQQSETAGGLLPGVEKLRREYGNILGDIIVHELVVQDLEQRGMEVTPEELKEAEDLIRADYPDGAFEQVLVEEYIDLNTWRERLKYYKSMQKFYSSVLRPSIKIDYKEAQEYYRAHISDYYLSGGVKLLVVRGPTRDMVEKGMEQYRENKSVEALTTAFGQVEAREIVVREGNLPPTWATTLKGLEPGQSSAVMADGAGFEVLVFLERIPAKVLEPAQAYPLVEEALLGIKMREAFSQWLEQTLLTANIEVSEHLLPSAAGEEEQYEEAAPMPVPQEGVVNPEGVANQDEGAANGDEGVYGDDEESNPDEIPPPDDESESEVPSGQ